MAPEQDSQPLDFTKDEAWETCRLRLPTEEIAYLVAVLEAYDNQFLLRTEDRGLGLVRIWYSLPNRPVLEDVLLDLKGQIPVNVLAFAPGMEMLDEIYPPEKQD